MQTARAGQELSSSQQPQQTSNMKGFYDASDCSAALPPGYRPVRRSNSVVRLGLAKEFLREMKECFDTFDKNRDGSISVDELSDVMKMLGLEQNQDQLQVIYSFHIQFFFYVHGK